MESLIPFLVIGYVIYRWRSQFNEFVKRRQQEGGKQPQNLHDFIKSLSDLQEGSSGSSDPVTPIPFNRRVTRVTPETDDLFKGDKWRRQLFIAAVLLGVGYLVYLLVI